MTAGDLFVVWGFPKASETFIHRELVEMERLGGTVRVLAAYRIPRPDLAGPLVGIADRATYLGSNARIARKGLAWAARHPVRFATIAADIGRMPHRTPKQRARAMAMVLAAASVADEAAAMGVRYVHAHFAARATELAMALARMLDVPYGVTAHAYDIYKDANILPQKIAGARAVLTCTSFNLEHLRGLAPEHARKIHLVHHGIDLEAAPPPSPLPGGDETRFLAVGRLVPKKGFVHLVDAMGLLRERGVDARLTILGGGEELARLKEAVHARGLEDRVTLPGDVPNRRVWDELAQSHALVMPSIRDDQGDMDGIPNVILEAMASGRPVVGTALSGIPEVVLPDRTGWLVPPGDARALADAMEKLAKDRDAAARMGRAGRALIEEHFDVRKNVHRQLALLSAS